MSEFRQDLVSGDWIISAPERSRRPELLIKKQKTRQVISKKNCPFEDLKKSGNWPPLLAWPNEKDWKITVIKNKYPAVLHKTQCASEFFHGPYRLKTGIGEHELLITRDHFRSFTDLKPEEALRIFLILQERYRSFAKDKCSIYASAFFNWGPTAGASIYHPHYQILSLPIIPPHIKASLFGSKRFFRKHKKCARCAIIEYEQKEKKRIIEENPDAIAFIPFASKKPFEVSIFPKKHLPSFEETPSAVLRASAVILQSVLRKIKKRLHDPDLNFFIHSTPFGDKRKYGFHHWHIEVVPQITTWGGFEFSTGIDINVVDPEKAAAILRS